MSRVVCFKADPALLERLDAYARRVGASRSEVIRAAIAAYLAEVAGPEDTDAGGEGGTVDKPVLRIEMLRVL